MTNVLITGGAGFIGSNLAEQCVSERLNTFVVDDLSNGRTEFLPDGLKMFYNNDFSSHTILTMVKSGFFDTVFHLAAMPRVSYSVKFPLKTHKENVTKTLKLIDACRGNVRRFIFSSSSSVYGDTDVRPTPEDTPFGAKSPYALQKVVIEQYLKLYHKLYGLDSCSLRYFNVFGKNQLGDGPYATAVSAWLTSIMNGDNCRSDGTGEQSRDMCHVDNVVNANILAFLRDEPINGESYNVACGDSVTNNEILEFLKKVYPGGVKVDHAPWRQGDVMHTQADVSKAKNDLGYVPTVKFWDGLGKTMEWYEGTYGYEIR